MAKQESPALAFYNAYGKLEFDAAIKAVSIFGEATVNALKAVEGDYKRLWGIDNAMKVNEGVAKIAGDAYRTWAASLPITAVMATIAHEGGETTVSVSVAPETLKAWADALKAALNGVAYAGDVKIVCKPGDVGLPEVLPIAKAVSTKKASAGDAASTGERERTATKAHFSSDGGVTWYKTGRDAYIAMFKDAPKTGFDGIQNVVKDCIDAGRALLIAGTIGPDSDKLARSEKGREFITFCDLVTLAKEPAGDAARGVKWYSIAASTPETPAASTPETPAASTPAA